MPVIYKLESEKIALSIQQNQLEQAIKHLINLISILPEDEYIWQQLIELYIEISK